VDHRLHGVDGGEVLGLHGHPGAFGRKGLRAGQASALAAAGDEHYFVIQLRVHHGLRVASDFTVARAVLKWFGALHSQHLRRLVMFVFNRPARPRNALRGLALVLSGLALTALQALQPAQAGTSVLFIGNSFTYGAGAAVRFYRANTVRDLNNEGIGGVPALFKSFAQQAGVDVDVYLETRGGSGLDFHYENKLAVLGQRPWDRVVMHGFSTLDAKKPGDPATLVATAKLMAQFFRSRNPKVDIHLMATWARADQTYPREGAWYGKPIDAMARDVRAGYDLAAAGAAVQGVIPVGQAFNRAMQTGVADPNPYDGIEAGKINLWTTDHYHASDRGYYLEALVIFGHLTGRDPRSLGENECSGYELGLSRPEIKALQQVAFDELAAAGLAQVAPLVLPKPVPPERCLLP
jgi:hypothetical protein